MKNLLLLFILYPVISFSQCPDSKSNEYKQKAEQYGDISYSTLATYYYYKCQCENGIGNRTTEQVQALVKQYNALKANKAGNNSIEIEGQHKVQWVNLATYTTKCSEAKEDATNSNTETSNNNKNIANEITNQSTEIISDLNSGNLDNAKVNSVKMAIEGAENLSVAQTFTGLSLGVISAFSKKKPNGTITKDVWQSQENGYWHQGEYSNGVRVGKLLIAKDRDFKDLVGIQIITKTDQYRPDYIAIYKNEFYEKEFSGSDEPNKEMDVYYEKKGFATSINFYKKTNKNIDIQNPEDYFDSSILKEFSRSYSWIRENALWDDDGKLVYHHKKNYRADNCKSDFEKNSGKDTNKGFLLSYYPNGKLAYDIKFNKRRIIANTNLEAFYDNGQKIYSVSADEDSCIPNEITIFKPNGEESHTEYIGTHFNCEKQKCKGYDYTNGYLEDIYYNKPQTVIRYHSNGKVKTKIEFKSSRSKITKLVTEFDKNGNPLDTYSDTTKSKLFEKGYYSYVYN